VLIRQSAKSLVFVPIKLATKLHLKLLQETATDVLINNNKILAPFVGTRTVMSRSGTLKYTVGDICLCLSGTGIRWTHKSVNFTLKFYKITGKVKLGGHGLKAGQLGLVSTSNYSPMMINQ